MQARPPLHRIPDAGAPARAVLRSPLTWGLALHATSRVFFYAAGVRFDASTLPDFWQFVDPALLRDDLARSLFYLHSQPPLFNAFLGAVLKLAPRGAEPAFFWSCFLALGVVLHVSLYALVRAAGAGRFSAACAALLFSISPAVICYESWLFYTYPVAVLLSAAAALVHRYVAQRRVATGLFLFTLIAAVALMHGFFHLLWCLVVLGLVARAVPRGERRRTFSVATPLLLVVALYSKNAILFGQFTASSWLGMNLASITLHNAPPADIAALVRDGTLSSVARVPAFSPLEYYPRQPLRPSEFAAPILVIPTKRSGVANLHHIAYLRISQRYLRDALALIRARPDIYLRNGAVAFGIYALPATEYPFVGLNRHMIGSWDRAWRIVPDGALIALLSKPGRPDLTDLRSLAGHAAWGWVVLLVVALVGSTAAGLRAFRDPELRPRAAMLLFIAFCVAYVTLLGNGIELGENNRFRFVIDPLIWATVWGLASAHIRRPRAAVCCGGA